SQQLRPAPWKLALAQKALAYYRGYWKGHRHPAFVPWQSAAYAEAYRHSKDAGCAEFVFEMNDWLCTLQYNQLNGQNPLWFGGFHASHQDGNLRVDYTQHAVCAMVQYLRFIVDL